MKDDLGAEGGKICTELPYQLLQAGSSSTTLILVDFYQIACNSLSNNDKPPHLTACYADSLFSPVSCQNQNSGAPVKVGLVQLVLEG